MSMLQIKNLLAKVTHYIKTISVQNYSLRYNALLSLKLKSIFKTKSYSYNEGMWGNHYRAVCCC